MECGERVGEGWFFLGAEDEGPDATDVGDINDLFEGVGLFAAAKGNDGRLEFHEGQCEWLFALDDGVLVSTLEVSDVGFDVGVHVFCFFLGTDRRGTEVDADGRILRGGFGNEIGSAGTIGADPTLGCGEGDETVFGGNDFWRGRVCWASAGQGGMRIG